jgi:hypothetical protein
MLERHAVVAVQLLNVITMCVHYIIRFPFYNYIFAVLSIYLRFHVRSRFGFSGFQHVPIFAKFLHSCSSRPTPLMANLVLAHKVMQNTKFGSVTYLVHDPEQFRWLCHYSRWNERGNQLERVITLRSSKAEKLQIVWIQDIFSVRPYLQEPLQWHIPSFLEFQTPFKYNTKCLFLPHR